MDSMTQKNKYGNKKVELRGIKFDSKTEAEFYIYLLKLKEEGEIKDIVLQEQMILQEKFKKYGKNHRAITYTVDFTVIDKDGKLARIDVKGMETPQGNIKRKMYDYLYPEPLVWVAKSKKWGNEDGWIEYDRLKKLRRNNKKVK